MTFEELDTALKEIEQVTDAARQEELINNLVQRLTEYPVQ